MFRFTYRKIYIKAFASGTLTPSAARFLEGSELECPRINKTCVYVLGCIDRICFCFFRYSVHCLAEP